MSKPEETKSNFIRTIIDEDLASGKHQSIVTRFPPEPNGYLHIGHAKSICLNFGLAQDYPGRCHLRFDDTNPVTEDTEYVESIQNDIKWLGFDWGEHLYFASDYFERMYDLAVVLIKKGKAYVDDQPVDDIREQRGTFEKPGVESPNRNRSVEENLDLFRRMREGEFEDGAMVLRAKIDMTSPNILMRDPLLYRIKHAHHHRTGDDWCIYPMYDYAHCLEDAIEEVTHSICTLEFENNRELYDWVIAETEIEHAPRQYEFARLSLNYTVMSKRKLLQLVKDNHVDGWDDPRMPTVAGMRRRGVTPEAIRRFADIIGVAKANSTVDVSLFEYCIRDDLNHRAKRVMCVTDPLKVVITNYPEGEIEELDANYWPEDVPKDEYRKVPFSREVYIERADFDENPPKGWRRLAPGVEVRFRYAYYVTCTDVIKDDEGNIVELHCTYDPETRGGWVPHRKVKGTLHWVSAAAGLPCKVNLYDRLFTEENPGGHPERDFLEFLNPQSLVVADGFVEPSVKDENAGTRYQFERLGFFCSDMESTSDALVFNRIVTLKDSWAKQTSDEKPEQASTPKTKNDAPKRSAKEVRAEERAKEHAEDPALAARYAKYHGEFGLNEKLSDLLAGDSRFTSYFDGLAAECDPKLAAVWLVEELAPNVADDAEFVALPFTSAQFLELIALVDGNEISTAAGREVLAEMIESGGSAEAIVDAKGLRIVSDAASLGPIIDKVITDNDAMLTQYRDGNKKLIGFFIGQVMKATGGAADATAVRELLAKKLDA